MLKVEPTEAERVILPWPDDPDGEWLAGLAEELDTLVRQQGDDAARAWADEVILRKRIGLDRDDCDRLRTAAEALCARRHTRSVPE
jgi:hypothetical protein